MLKKLTQETESELARDLDIVLVSKTSQLTEANMDFTELKLKKGLNPQI